MTLNPDNLIVFGIKEGVEHVRWMQLLEPEAGHRTCCRAGTTSAFNCEL